MPATGTGIDLAATGTGIDPTGTGIDQAECPRPPLIANQDPDARTPTLAQGLRSCSPSSAPHQRPSFLIECIGDIADICWQQRTQGIEQLVGVSNSVAGADGLKIVHNGIIVRSLPVLIQTGQITPQRSDVPIQCALETENQVAVAEIALAGYLAFGLGLWQQLGKDTLSQYPVTGVIGPANSTSKVRLSACQSDQIVSGTQEIGCIHVIAGAVKCTEFHTSRSARSNAMLQGTDALFP